MRAALVCFALLFAGPAFAQTAPEPGGAGPFRFGMTQDEARAAMPGEWGVQPYMNGEMLSSSAFTGESGESAAYDLVFEIGRLTQIRRLMFVMTGSGAVCENTWRGVVRTLEATHGPFTASPAVNEPRRGMIEETTSVGSRLRLRNRDTPAFEGRAAAREPRTVQVNARLDETEADEQFCLLTTIYWDRPNAVLTLADIPPAPTELERVAATLLEGANPWSARPDGMAFADSYPEEALANELQARVVLDCLIGADGAVRCAVASEEPADQGFGDAARAIAMRFRAAPEVNGQQTAGRRVRIPISFRLE
ncbi:MAG: TonB family protein [Hyphomonadaceae bacterium]